MKKEGVVNSKEEFWYQMDLEDLENAGAFLSREMWDKYILKKEKGKLKITPTDHTKGRRK